MKEPVINFGNNLKKYRKNAGYSRAQLAQMISYSEKSIEHWELDGSLPPVITVCKLASIFDTTIEHMLFLDEKEVKYLLAVDGGGTKTEFLLTDIKKKELARCFLGASNPVDIGMDSAKRILEQGIREVCKGIDISEVSAFVGLAGGMTGDNKAQINKFLSQFGFAFYSNGSDTENVLQVALNGGDGVAVIMGTGVIAFSQAGGVRHRIGGWGYHIDKGGSGYDFGSDALYEALKYIDGRDGSKIICKLIEDMLGASLPDSISAIYSGGKSKVASFSPVVFKAYDMGDEVAAKIIDSNVNEVCRIILTGLSFLPDKKGKVVICGGLGSNSEVLEPFFKKYLGSNVNVIFSQEPVVNGALMLAEKLKDGGSSNA